MTIAIHCNIVECRCSMNTRGVMEILLGKSLYVQMANLMAKPVNLLPFMIVANTSNAPTYIIHTGDDELSS